MSQDIRDRRLKLDGHAEFAPPPPPQDCSGFGMDSGLFHQEDHMLLGLLEPAFLVILDA